MASPLPLAPCSVFCRGSSARSTTVCPRENSCVPVLLFVWVCVVGLVVAVSLPCASFATFAFVVAHLLLLFRARLLASTSALFFSPLPSFLAGLSFLLLFDDQNLTLVRLSAVSFRAYGAAMQFNSPSASLQPPSSWMAAAVNVGGSSQYVSASEALSGQHKVLNHTPQPIVEGTRLRVQLAEPFRSCW